jgi:hypothetical protein
MKGWSVKAVSSNLFLKADELLSADLSGNLIEDIPCGLFFGNPKLQTV